MSYFTCVSQHFTIYKMRIVNRWMNKQNVMHIYNGILFSLKQEGNSDTCNNMDELWRHYAKWNKPVAKKTNSVRFHLGKLFRAVRFIETESRRAAARGWRKEVRDGELVLNGCKILVSNEEQSSRDRWRSWLLNNGKVLSDTELYTSKWLLW